jgi:hypothetical protein
MNNTTNSFKYLYLTIIINQTIKQLSKNKVASSLQRQFNKIIKTFIRLPVINHLGNCILVLHAATKN